VVSVNVVPGDAVWDTAFTTTPSTGVSPALN
jgi:hypothetical protein